MCVFMYISRMACWQLCSLKTISFSRSETPCYLLGNEKHSLQRYNKTMFIKTGYVGKGFLLPHYTPHLTKIQSTLGIHLILLLVPSCSPFIIHLDKFAPK